MSNVSESHVEVKTSPTAGNGLFATKDIGAGELVVMVNRPLIGVLDLPRLEDTCSNCFLWSAGSVEGGLLPNKPTINWCVGCKTVKYCSKVRSISLLPCCWTRRAAPVELPVYEDLS